MCYATAHGYYSLPFTFNSSSFISRDQPTRCGEGALARARDSDTTFKIHKNLIHVHEGLMLMANSYGN